MYYRLIGILVFLIINTKSGETEPRWMTSDEEISTDPFFNEFDKVSKILNKFFNTKIGSYSREFDSSGNLDRKFRYYLSQLEKNLKTFILQSMEKNLKTFSDIFEQKLNDRLKVLETNILNTNSRQFNTEQKPLENFMEKKMEAAFEKQFNKFLEPLQKTVATWNEERREITQKIPVIENFTNILKQENQKSLEMLFTKLDDSLDTVNQNFLNSMNKQRKWLQKNICKPETNSSLPETCGEALKNSNKQSNGIYLLEMPGMESFNAYCIHGPIDKDMPAWMVIQRRENGDKSFERGWNDYKQGFGDLQNDYWIGLERLHEITSRENYELLIGVQDWNAIKNYAKYDKFLIGSEEEKYPLSVLGAFNGTFDDSFTYHAGQKFTTKDSDNDDRNDGNCAVTFKGGWWYGDCHVSNLNGVYNSTEYGEGINWKGWHGYEYSLEHSFMAIRPKKL